MKFFFRVETKFNVKKMYVNVFLFSKITGDQSFCRKLELLPLRSIVRFYSLLKISYLKAIMIEKKLFYFFSSSTFYRFLNAYHKVRYFLKFKLLILIEPFLKLCQKINEITFNKSATPEKR